MTGLKVRSLTIKGRRCMDKLNFDNSLNEKSIVLKLRKSLMNMREDEKGEGNGVLNQVKKWRINSK